MSVFNRNISPFSEQLIIRQFRLEEDSELLHEWVNMDYAVFWGMNGSTLLDVKEEYSKLISRHGYGVLVGEVNGKVKFLFECYQPEFDLISDYYSVQKGDIGVHIIVSPPSDLKIPNFTWHVFSEIMNHLFENKTTNRILVEPDIRNKKMFALCERIGFETNKVVELPHKTAQLAFLQREKFLAIQSSGIIQKRTEMNKIDNSVSPQQAVSHLQKDIWSTANRLLIKKALTEFSHEELIIPKSIAADGQWKKFEVFTDNTDVVYHFTAKQLYLNHLLIKPDSIRKTKSGQQQELDAIHFIQEFQKQLGITDKLMPNYLEEIISTLNGSAYKLTKGNPNSKELVDADFQTIEQSMTEGHPCFVANNGRIGFDSGDYRSYAPETGNSFSLMWLAGHRDHAKYEGKDSLPYDFTMNQELGQEQIGLFNEKLKNLGLNPNDYIFLPVHPWQWFNKLAQVFAPEIAKGNLVCLGYGTDQYLAQQSVRTMFNISHPKKFYVKSALSVLNMGFMRGLPYYYLGTAPVMANWLEDLLYNDPFLANNGFRMLSEVASVSYINSYFEEFGPHNDYNKMLASLWRESPAAVIKEGEQLMTMAALLHVDHEQNAFLPELIKASGLEINDWLSKYFEAYLIPLLHCFYKYDLVFMPHGENLIMALENSIPKYAFLKDITEEACILDENIELPEGLERLRADVPEDVKLLSIFIDVFDDIFRFMVHILEEHANYNQDKFWSILAKCIQEYQAKFPELNDKFERYDPFAESFQLSCLNRLQINNHKQMIDLDDPVALLQFTSRLNNPLAQYKTVAEPSI
ncbi:GNAT family N-acetyltransferase [Reichenbachiella versicolor]|uniref:GNAT family N-acetyltransferase n=1 Tax=Reichenbachiella versicolor TaxID=1821036 RepID=UPI000D6DD871|nr:GNAT family N-acetyltransferase [Reichenbachiella versicolor]